MLEKVIFYNYYGHGDLFTSREFIKDLMEKIPAQEYFYAHLRNPRILADIENLQYMHPTDSMKNKNAWKQIENALYINTWIGRDSKYVLPGIGCTVEQHHLMYSHYTQGMQIPPLTKLMKEYIPSIDYTKFDLKSSQYFIENNREAKVLICNELVQSSQAENFDMGQIIKVIATEYKNILFLITKQLPFQKDNVVYTGDITLVSDSFDLIDISYLSRFCNLIIGRCSGPHVHTMVRENCMDTTKTNLSFTYNKNAEHFVHLIDIPMKKLWSPATKEGPVYSIIKETIEQCIL